MAFEKVDDCWSWVEENEETIQDIFNDIWKWFEDDIDEYDGLLYRFERLDEDDQLKIMLYSEKWADIQKKKGKQALLHWFIEDKKYNFTSLKKQYESGNNNSYFF